MTFVLCALLAKCTSCAGNGADYLRGWQSPATRACDEPHARSKRITLAFHQRLVFVVLLCSPRRGHIQAGRLRSSHLPMISPSQF